MSFGGSVSAMISSLKNNARKRKTIFDKKSKSIRGTINKVYLSEIKADPAQLEEIRSRMKKENKIKFIKIILTVVAILALFVFLISIYK